MNNYIFDEKLIKKFDHIDVDLVDPKNPADQRCYVHFYLTDGQCLEYGPYKDKRKAKEVENKIVDDNVNNKFPFLKEPLKAENVNIDGAAILMAETLRTTRYDYIHKARALHRTGYNIPTSSKEYIESGIDKKRIEDIERAKRSLALLDPEKDAYIYKKVQERLFDLENGSSGIYSIIRFMEKGAMGSLHILNGGLSAQDILNEWKMEALGYGKYPKRYAKHC